jgi:hypothetical protein
MQHNPVIAVICLVLALMTGLLSGCERSASIEPVTNNDVINFRDFSLDASPVNLATSVNGTVFVRGNLDKPEDITVRIAVFVEIDPVDWGGVSLLFPEGWKITHINNSLVEINDPYYSNLASVWTGGGAPEQGGQSMVLIGGALPGEKLPGVPRKGILVIDADYVWENKTAPEALSLDVALGSKDGNIKNPVSMKVDVPLLADFRPQRIEFLFPRQRQAEELETTQQIEGELVLEQGTLRVDGYLVLWPFEYWASSDTENVWIKFGDSTTPVAGVGDVLIIPGYEVNAYTASQKTLSFSFPEGIEGPFWLADSIALK